MEQCNGCGKNGLSFKNGLCTKCKDVNSEFGKLSSFYNKVMALDVTRCDCNVCISLELIKESIK
jgi:hypothetical protein